MKADAETEAAVIAVLKEFAEACTRRDLDSALSLFDTDSDVVVIGTGADEKRVGQAEIKAQLERDMSQSKAFSMEIGWNSVSAMGSVAWVVADSMVRATVSGKEIGFPLRTSAVLERRGNKWLLMQMHSSLPAQGQAEGESFPKQ